MFRKLEYLIQLRENGATFVDVWQFQIFKQITQIFGKFDSVTRKWIHFRRGVEIPDFFNNNTNFPKILFSYPKIEPLSKTCGNSRFLHI
jgi:hypothetical protein